MPKPILRDLEQGDDEDLTGQSEVYKALHLQDREIRRSSWEHLEGPPAKERTTDYLTGEMELGKWPGDADTQAKISGATSLKDLSAVTEGRRQTYDQVLRARDEEKRLRAQDPGFFGNAAQSFKDLFTPDEVVQPSVQAPRPALSAPPKPAPPRSSSEPTSRFMVEDGEIIDTRNRQIISTDQFNKLSSPQEKDEIERQLREADGLAEDAPLTKALPPFPDRRQEADFQAWYKKNFANRGINANPDDPQHFYDYRRAFQDGMQLTPDATDLDEAGQPRLHGDSRYKLPGHPREFVDTPQGRLHTTTGQTDDYLMLPDTVVHGEQPAGSKPLIFTDKAGNVTRTGPLQVPAAPEPPSPKSVGEGLTQATYNYFQGVAQIPADALKSIAIASKTLDAYVPDSLADSREIEDRFTYRLGHTIDRLAKRLFPADPAMQQNFIVGVLPQALGSMTGFLAGGLTGVITKAPVTTTAILGAQVGGAEQYEDAKEHKADESTRQTAFWLGSAVGSSEALPIAGILNRFNKATGGKFLTVLKETGVTAAQEFLQEWGQQVGSNIIAQQYYDEHRSWFEGAGVSGAAGGATGAIVGFLAGVLQGRKSRRQHQNEGVTEGASPLFTAPDPTAGLPDELQVTGPQQPFLIKQPQPVVPQAVAPEQSLVEPMPVQEPVQSAPIVQPAMPEAMIPQAVEQEPVIEMPPVTVTPEGATVEDIHRLAEQRGIPWDNDPGFMDLTERVTGKRHLDELTQEELDTLADALDVTSAIEEFTPSKPFERPSVTPSKPTQQVPAEVPPVPTPETATQQLGQRAQEVTRQTIEAKQPEIQAYLQSLPRDEAKRAYARALVDGLKRNQLPPTPNNLTGAEVQAIQEGLIKAVSTGKATRQPAIAPDTVVDQAAHAAATSPLNDVPTPTEAMKQAGAGFKTRVPQETRDEAVRLYKAGLTQEQVASELGVSDTVVFRSLREAGVSARKFESLHNKKSEQLKEEAVRLYADEKKTLQEVAKRLNLGLTTVARWTKLAGVGRSQSEALAMASAQGRRPPRALNIPWQSTKTNKWEFADSKWEAVRMSQLDADESVKSWTKLADRVPYADTEGKQRHYAPDFLVEYSDGRSVVEEIKPEARVSEPQNTAKANAAREFFKAKNIDYRVVTEKEIGTDDIEAFEPEGFAKITEGERDRRRLDRRAKAERDRRAKRNAAKKDVIAQNEPVAITVGGQTDTVDVNPSPAQKESGVYKKAHVQIAGLDISIENPQGSTRSGTDRSGKPWSITMKDHYGYIKGTKGKDKDHLDVFIKPGTPEDYSGSVFVVDQRDPTTKRFDEHKIILGARDSREARSLYQQNYAKDWNGLGSLSAFTMPQFKKWLKSGDHKKPAVDYKIPAETKPPAPEPKAVTPDTITAPPETKAPTPETVQNPIIESPRSELPPADNAEMLLRAEKAKADLEIAGKETGRRKVFDYDVQGQGGTPEVTRLQSAAPDWYRELTTGPGPMTRKQIDTAIAKIIKDEGSDVGKAVERVKAAMLADREFSRTPWGDDAEAIRRGDWPSWVPKPGEATTPEQAVTTKPAEQVPTPERAVGPKKQADQPFALTPKATKQPKPKEPEQLGIPVPPPTVGERPIIGREVTPEEAPLFSKAAQTPDAEQVSLPDEVTTEMPDVSPTGIIAQALRTAADQIEGKKIEDVGKKIGGARKDRWASRGLTLEDLAEMSGGEESKYITKANIWKPDYASMVKDGTDPKAAALVKIVYDRLGAKPAKDTPEGRRQYVEMMGYVKQAYSSIKTLDDVKQAANTVRYELAGLPKPSEMRGTSQADRDLLQPKFDTFWSVAKDRSDPFYLDFAAQRRAAKMVAEGFPEQAPWTRRYSITNYGGPNLTPEGIAYYEKKGGPWAVVEKSSKRILAYKPDEASATAEAQRLYAEKPDKDKGREPERPHLDDLKRSGTDYRGGKHVTAEDFRMQFGFRGVEFGNYAASDERQKHVDQAYDALMDLSTLLGVPPKAVSLNGTLGLAFGARGGGRFKAHYEPSKLVINITKVNGPGALAHEWGHALDHYFGELDRPDAYAGSPKGASGWMQLGKYTGAPERRYTKSGVEEVQRLPNLRPEMRQAFDRVMDALFHRSKTKAEAVREAELKLEELQGLITKYEQDIAKTKEKAATPPDKMTVSWLKQAEDYLKTLKVRREVAGSNLVKLTDGEKPDGGYGRVETSFYKQAQTLSGPTGDYWKRPTEMFARAFESYVFDKLGTDSQYLVHSVEADRYTKEKGYKGNPYPEGPERDAIRSALDGLFDTMESKETDQGTALHEPGPDEQLTSSQQMFENSNKYAVRPGEQQRLNWDLAREALGDLDRAGQAVSSTTGAVDRPGIPARTIGLGISPEFINDGVIDLTGRQVRSAKDLAQLAQVYRDPRFETFRIFYTKNGKILAHEGLTSRMPGMVRVFLDKADAQRKMAMIQERMDALDATGYYLLHNHPSGNSNPSAEDFKLTERLAMQIPGFKGHVIIDSNEYTALEFNEDDNIEGKKVEMPEMGEDKLLTPSIPNPLMAIPIRSSSDVATVGQQIKSPDGYAVVLYRTKTGTRAIQEISAEFLSDPKKAGPYMQEQAVAFGAQDVITHYKASGNFSNAQLKALQKSADQLIADGILRDHVVSGPTGLPMSRADAGVTKRPGMLLGQRESEIASEAVQEETPDYGNPRYKEEAAAYMRERAAEEKTPGQTGTIEPRVARGRLASAAVSVRPLLLGSLGLHQLSMVYGKDHKEVADYNKASQQMEADFISMTRDSDAILKRWDKLDRATSDQMARVMEDARLANYDPDPLVTDDYIPELFLETSPEAKLRAAFNALPDNAKAVYRTVRDFYSDMAHARFEAIRARIQRSGGTPENRKALLDRLEVAYEKVRSKVYFPFTRFGEHLVIARKMRDGKEVDRVVSAFESPREAERAAAQMRKDGWTVKQTIAKEYSQDKQGAASKVVRGILDVVDGIKDDPAVEGTIDSKQQLKDAINQAFLQALPDLSYAKHFIHAKDVKGFSKDAIRAFAHSALHGAHHLSRINNADILTKAIASLDERITETAEGDTTEARQVFNELVKRHNDILNPNTSPVAAWLGKLGFTMSLAGSVATGITNATQVPLVTYPWLGARYGAARTSVALAKAYKDFLDPRTLNADSLFDASQSPRINEDDRRMLTELQRRGRIDLTQTMDLSGRAAQDNLSRVAKQHGSLQDKIAKVLGFTFHAPEVMNRQVTAMATYRLARSKGMDHAESIDAAEQAIIETHFIYTAENRPRFMSGNVLRVLTMFKQYSQNIAFLYGRAAQIALTKAQATKDEKRIAAKQLTMMLGLQYAAAGALGLPFVGTVASLFTAFLNGFKDDDDEIDWEVELRKELADLLGKEGGEVAAHGLSRMTPWDMAGRLGQSDLFFRAPKREREGRAAFMDWVTSFSGPVLGYATNAYLGVGDVIKGIADADSGHFLRGVEELTPTFARNIVKAFRYQMEGGVRTRDRYKQLDVNAAEQLGQFFGFTPSRVAEMYESVTAIKNAEHKLVTRRKELLDQFASAYQDKNAEAMREASGEIRVFNEKHPDLKITDKTLTRSQRARLQRADRTKEGLYLPKTREFLRSRGDFADIDDDAPVPSEHEQKREQKRKMREFSKDLRRYGPQQKSILPDGTYFDRSPFLATPETIVP